MMKKYVLAVVLMGSLVGCTKSPSEQVAADIEGSSAANKEAPGMLEWHSSDFNPEQLFAKWKKDKALASEVCKELLAKDASTLTLFENELNNPENKELVKDCQGELQKKLEQYWKEQREKL